tara:strand:- start:172 stop:471 length:300 start_codon:yes stop_codon:yes gene_type:complete
MGVVFSEVQKLIGFFNLLVVHVKELLLKFLVAVHAHPHELHILHHEHVRKLIFSERLKVWRHKLRYGFNLGWQINFKILGDDLNIAKVSVYRLVKDFSD